MTAAATLDRQRFEIKLGDYAVASASALLDASVWMRAQDYRRAASSRLFPIDGTQIQERIPAGEFHVSRKVDGEFTLLVFRHGEAFTVNPGGTVRVGLPFLEEAARLLSKAGVKEAQIAGELYVAVPDRRARVHDVSRVAGRPTEPDDLGKIRFAAFDLVSCDGQLTGSAFKETWARLQKLLEKGSHCHLVEGKFVRKLSEIQDLYAQWVEKEGAEGLVARGEEGGFFKIKPRHSLDVAVIGFSESTGDRQGLLHDLLVALIRPEGTFHVLGRVGGGFSDDQRKEMLSDLKDRAVASEYSEVNADHLAYQMVHPDWVMEMSCLDLVSQNTRGGPIGRMVLDWEANNGHSQYKVLRRLPLASVISPQFVRLREDKQVHPADVRFAQVLDRIDLPQADQDARRFELPKSQVVKREVYTKEMKGECLIRKFVLWKTNKETIAEDYPAYVVHVTDFSPNRKDPLARDLRVSSSLPQIQQLYADLLADYITKGWALKSAFDADAHAAESTPGQAEAASNSAMAATTAATKSESEAATSQSDAPAVAADAEPKAAKAPAKRAASRGKTKDKPATAVETSAPAAADPAAIGVIIPAEEAVSQAAAEPAIAKEPAADAAVAPAEEAKPKRKTRTKPR